MIFSHMKVEQEENKDKMNGLFFERCKICPAGHVSKKKYITERKACLEAGFSTNDQLFEIM